MTGSEDQRAPGHAGRRCATSAISAYKVRVVLDLIRGQSTCERAREILAVLRARRRHRRSASCSTRPSPTPSTTTARSTDELYVSACYADEGRTIKRWRPRARGRATRIRKRTCHITVIVSRLPDDRLARLRAKQRRRGRHPPRPPRRRRPQGVAGHAGRRPRGAAACAAVAASRRPKASADEVVPVEELEEQGIVDQQDAALDEDRRGRRSRTIDDETPSTRRVAEARGRRGRSSAEAGRARRSRGAPTDEPDDEHADEEEK